MEGNPQTHRGHANSPWKGQNLGLVGFKPGTFLLKEDNENTNNDQTTNKTTNIK